MKLSLKKKKATKKSLSISKYGSDKRFLKAYQGVPETCLVLVNPDVHSGPGCHLEAGGTPTFRNLPSLPSHSADCKHRHDAVTLNMEKVRGFRVQKLRSAPRDRSPLSCSSEHKTKSPRTSLTSANLGPPPGVIPH